jgi:hypothetical protein
LREIQDAVTVAGKNYSSVTVTVWTFTCASEVSHSSDIKRFTTVSFFEILIIGVNA